VAGEDIETVRRGLDALSRRDLEALVAEADPEVEFHPLLSVWQRNYRGHDGVRQWWSDVADQWEEFAAEIVDWRDLGDGALLVNTQWRGRGKQGSIEVAGPGALVVRFRDGRALTVDVYHDESFALAAEG
jgi:ketosteroid isomerase-like protein